MAGWIKQMSNRELRSGEPNEHERPTADADPAPARAYAFLFDGSVDGLSANNQLQFFVAAVLGAIARGDPEGRTSTQFRIGLPSLTGFAERTTAVHGEANRSGRTVSHDIDMYKYVVWEWLDSLSEGWSSIDREKGEEIFRRHTYECVALSALTDDIRDSVDTALQALPGYVGGFAIDSGNPVHRGGFFDSLIPAAAISGGAVIQDRTIEGDEWPGLDGAEKFKPGGLVWQNYGWIASEGPKGLPKVDLSPRGADAAAGVARKYAPSVEQRVIEEIERAMFLNNERKTYEFGAVGQPTDILQALMPEGKFTHYLFNREHKNGASKAAFIIEELGIDPEDWRYLAAQFYFGLTAAQPSALAFNEWEDGYGVRFDVVMRVRSRAGNTAVLNTGWNLNPGALPSLSTAHPGDRNADAVEPGDVPILPPGKRSDADWEQLWTWANQSGMRAADATVPTPMYLVDYEPIAEGEIGTALVRVADARRGLARWLSRHGPGESDGYGGTVVFSPVQSQSHDRAAAWARTVTLTLRLNGIEAEVETFKN